jgi:hypothetical protein
MKYYVSLVEVDFTWYKINETKRKEEEEGKHLLTIQKANWNLCDLIMNIISSLNWII